MNTVDITVEELEGDQDTDSVYLTTPSESIPGDTLFGKVVQVVPGLSFLVVSGSTDGDALTTEELQGDADTDHKYIVTPKSMLGDSAMAGTALTGYTFQSASGPVLLVALTATGGTGAAETGATPTGGTAIVGDAIPS